MHRCRPLLITRGRCRTLLSSFGSLCFAVAQHALLPQRPKVRPYRAHENHLRIHAYRHVSERYFAWCLLAHRSPSTGSGFAGDSDPVSPTNSPRKRGSGRTTISYTPLAAAIGSRAATRQPSLSEMPLCTDSRIDWVAIRWATYTSISPVRIGGLWGCSVSFSRHVSSFL